MVPPTLGLVLAGGLSRRMGGGDKALMRLGDRTLLEHVAARLGPQCAAGLVLSANGEPARFAGFPGPVVADDVPDRPGPLAGILAGLDVAAARGIGWVVSVSGDTPFLPRDLVARLHAARADDASRPVHAASGARAHFTAALWPVDLRGDLRAALMRGERRVGAYHARHGAAAAVWPDIPLDPFLNVNTPADLVAAQALSDRAHEVGA